MTIKNNSSKDTVKSSKDGDFPKLKILNHSEIYDLVTKFIQKVVLIKDVELTISNRTSFKISIPQLPFISLLIADIYLLPDLKTYTVNGQKISLIQSEVMMNILFFGNEQISSLELAQTFKTRFNKGWATEQFAQYSKSFIPLYSNNLTIKPALMGVSKQFEDTCSVDAYFELHPEIVE
ncbi:phage neck terminator protein [Commensalibacter nepenthis]|uniref:Phage neck terminator protein gp12-like domain-containing protein n=1 Tax=Commensalibacter nepenthis TaxID=3043872 RepID=A0ABT6QA60_9PROT|nr:hypothetical protein [Commensalibacter sp. TBRC 10068]MDI2113795.1 hypothetical protein [Commensalibacter sp. TBRC 10068]